MIRVLAPGLLTTVQDLGRPGHAALGISACGAADAVALRIGNRLVGNSSSSPGAAALEMTLVGATLEFTADAWIALCGAECMAGRTRSGGGAECAVPMWTALCMAAGDILSCRTIRHGARTYLCVGGGLEVPLVLGSAATHVRSGMGGLHGRALRSGDTLKLAAAGAAAEPGRLAPWAVDHLYPRAAAPAAGHRWAAGVAIRRCDACDARHRRVHGERALRPHGRPPERSAAAPRWSKPASQ